jgi:hypothetical protein
MRRFLSVILVAGCAGSQTQLPPPEPYAANPTPEAATHCPTEAKAAKTAREAAIGADELPVGDAAATAVFRLAQCERAWFDRHVELGGPQDQAAIRAARDQVQNVRQLYAEAAAYKSPRVLIGSLARTGDLLLAYARKLRGLAGPGAAAADVEDVVGLVEREAIEAYRKALDAVEAWPNVASDSDVRGFVRSACTGAGKDAVRHPPCAR